MTSHKPNDEDLKGLARKARRLYKQGLLSTRVVQELEKKPGWTWDVSEYRFNTKLQQVIEFCGKNGSIPREKSTDAKERSLGNWLSHKKDAYKKNILSDQRKQAIDSALPGFSWQQNLPKIWLEKYHSAYGWSSRNQKIANPNAKNAEESRIGRWLQLQRQNFAKPGYNRSTPLSSEQKNLLLAIPFFHFGRFNKWQNRFIEVQEFVTDVGRLPRASNCKRHSSEFTLGKWLQRQREFYKKNKLTVEQITSLEELQNWCWDYDLDQKWIAKFELVEAWCKINNRKPLSNALDKEEKHHAVWLVRQRGIYKDHKRNQNRPLTKQQIQKLETLPDWYW